MKGEILLKQLCAICTVLFCIVVTGCRDDVKNIYKGEPEEPEEVPNDFDFSTSKSIDVKFKYDVPVGFQVYYEMYTTCPVSLDEDLSYVKNPTLLPIAGGYTDENGAISLTLDVAAFVDDIYLYSTQAGVSTLLRAELSGNTASVFEEYEPKKVDTEFLARSLDGDKRTAGAGYKNWPAWGYGTSLNPIKGKVTSVDNIIITEKVQTEINNSIKTTVANTTSLEGSRYRNNIVLTEEAEVKLYYFSHGASLRQNSLTYFTYLGSQGPNADPLFYLKDKLVMAFENLSTSDLCKGVQLKYKDVKGNWTNTFPGGTALSFALIADGNTDFKNIAFSEWNYNSYSIQINSSEGWAIRNNKPHMGVFKLSNSTAEKAYIVLCFEDYPWSESPLVSVGERTQTFDDDVFIMEVNPKRALPDDIPDPTPGEDENNPWKHFIKTSGVWAFEDNWPKNGDYDMNDIVLSYIRTLYMDEGYNVVSLTDEFTFLNNGANYSNAFGYVLGGKVNQKGIKSLNLTSQPKSSYSQNFGLDKDLDVATIMLFDNGKNVDKNATFNVHAEFNVPYPSYSDFSKNRNFGEPVNPFIVVNGITDNPRVEVHLPQYPPTEKNDNSLFGEEDDCSNGTTTYYISKKANNYPFAIDLSGVPLEMNEDGVIIPAFTTSPEGKPIDDSYSHFIDWVESGGTEYTDWYLSVVQ